MIKVKRVYDPPDPSDGLRVLVDRLWPRGFSKEGARITRWLREVAPSAELRAWFQHDVSRWAEFQRRYFAELDANRAAWEPLLEAARSGTVALLYSARDIAHNNAVALKVYLEARQVGSWGLSRNVIPAFAGIQSRRRRMADF